MSYFDTKLLGDLQQRISDHDRVQNFITSKLLSLIYTTMSLIIFGFVLALYNLKIFSIFILFSVIYVAWSILFLKHRRKIDYELFESLSTNQNHTYQFLTAIKEIKLQGCENRRRHEWEDSKTDVCNVQLKSMNLRIKQESVSAFINEIKNIFITVGTASYVIGGDMTLGMMLAVQYMVGQINSPVIQLVNLIYSFQDVNIALTRINEIHESQNEQKRVEGLSVRVNQIKDIRLNNVCFSYDPHSSRKILNRVSLTIPGGKVTAIVGSSGSGKTTLLKLILGFYDIQDGEIFIANKNLKGVDLKQWRKICGVVMQESFIFSESIRRNIAVSDGDIDEDKMLEAARMAEVTEFVEKLPLKFDTIIGRDGNGISEGQKQRILIARSIYKNPDYIFLDEATNSLDSQTEKIIVENLTKFYQGRTVIIAAHRLSTVRYADQIVVMQNGRPIEIGTHGDLINKRGEYFRLITNQIELS